MQLQMEARNGKRTRMEAPPERTDEWERERAVVAAGGERPFGA